MLDAAWERFGVDGFHHVSVDQIAATAGVTRGAVYHHFESKEALFEEVFSEVEAELVTATAVAAHQPNAFDALLHGCYAYISMASQRQIGQIVLIDAPAVLGTERYREIDESCFLPSLVNVLKALRQHDSASAISLLASAIFAAVCQLALIAHQHPQSSADIGSTLQLLLGSLS